MYYPQLTQNQEFFENKIGFSVLACAVVMNLLKKQRDAVGLSIYSDQYTYYAPEKGSDRHHRMLINQLEHVLENPNATQQTNTITFLHQIAEKMHRRSLIMLFTDMFQPGEEHLLFNALQHLKHNKHKVVVFHVIDNERELQFNFDATPRKFIDVESGEVINLYSENVKADYEKKAADYFKKIKLTCAQNKINYVPVNVGVNFEKIMTTYLVEKQKFG